MKITDPLGAHARNAARVTRNRVRRKLLQWPSAVYANILDGQRLWLALPADAGEPALRDPETGEIIHPVDDLPTGHADTEPGYRSVRWRLDEVLPRADDARLDVVALQGRGQELRPRPVQVTELDQPGAARALTTPDGAWQFFLGAAGGTLQVVRGQAARVSRVLDAGFVDRSASITCEADGRMTAELLLLDQDRRPVARLPMQRTDRGFERLVRDEDVPREPMSYRVALGSASDHVPVVRRRNELRIVDHLSVLMPLILESGTDHVGARVRFAPDGGLRIVRLDPLDRENS